MDATAARMALGQAITRAMHRKGWIQKDMARMVPCKPSRIGSLCAGTRGAHWDETQRLIYLFNDPEFNLAVVHYWSGGLLGWSLDGLDPGRAAAAACVFEELQELQGCLTGALSSLARQAAPGDETVGAMAEDLYLNLLDIVGVAHHLRIQLAHEHGLGAREMAEKHRQRRAEKGYTQRKNRPAMRAA